MRARSIARGRRVRSGPDAGPAEGPLRRLRVRAVRQDGRARRRGRRAAEGAPPPRTRRARRHAALRRHAVARVRAARGRPLGADVVRHGARGASISAACPAATCRSTSSSTTATSTGRTSTAPRPTPTPTTSSASPSCRAARSSCAKALGWIPDVVHANDWQTALVPVYVEHRRVGAAAARQRHRLHDPQPRLPGRVRRAARCSSPASGRSTTTRASSSTSARST